MRYLKTKQRIWSDTVHRKFDINGYKTKINLLSYYEKNGVGGEIWDKTMTNSISHGKLKNEIHGYMDSKSW